MTTLAPQSEATSLWTACCPADAARCLPSASLPWLRLAIGLFVAAQTMTLGLTVNLTPPEEQATTLLLHLGMRRKRSGDIDESGKR